MKYVPPPIRETAFNCPHCGALARQFWYSAHADPLNKDQLPAIIDAKKLDELNLDHVDKRRSGPSSAPRRAAALTRLAIQARSKGDRRRAGDRQQRSPPNDALSEEARKAIEKRDGKKEETT